MAKSKKRATAEGLKAWASQWHPSACLAGNTRASDIIALSQSVIDEEIALAGANHAAAV